MSGRKGMRRYPNAIKEEAIRLFFYEGRTRKQIAAQLLIGDEERVKKWVRTYRRKGLRGLICEPIGRPRKGEPIDKTQARIQYLEMENELLRNFLYGLGRR
jgi:transposase-like protein